MIQHKHLFFPFLLFICCAANGQVITRFAGNDTAGYSGDGGPAISAELYSPSGVVTDGSGNVYIAEGHNNRIRMVAPSGIISTVAGTGAPSYSGDGGAATLAAINNPAGLATDASGNLYIADYSNNVIRKVTAGGIISTIAGNTTAGFAGDGLAATLAELFNPGGVAVDNAGNVFIADNLNSRIRKVDNAGIITTIAGNGLASYSGDGGPALAAELDPRDIAADNVGNLYIADYGSSRVRKINTAGIISTIAGNGAAGYTGDGAAATSAELYYVTGVATDAAGNVYIADVGRNVVRKVNVSGIISTVAGNGVAGNSGDGGPATGAELNLPIAVTADGAGNIYIANLLANNVRKVWSVKSSVANYGRQNSEHMLQLWPEPNTGSFSISASSAINEPVNIVVTDIKGRTIKNIAGYTNREEQISLRVPPGSYYITVSAAQWSQNSQIVVR